MKVDILVKMLIKCYLLSGIFYYTIMDGKDDVQKSQHLNIYFTYYLKTENLAYSTN